MLRSEFVARRTDASDVSFPPLFYMQRLRASPEDRSVLRRLRVLAAPMLRLACVTVILLRVSLIIKRSWHFARLVVSYMFLIRLHWNIYEMMLCSSLFSSIMQ